jgi:glycosyltransferase involved in cell wall biosynthesis
MDSHEDGPPLSIGYVSPGWPPEAFSNGIVSYVAMIADQLAAMGFKATILTPRIAPGDWGDSVYSVDSDRASRGIARDSLERLAHRIAPQWASERVFRRGLVAAVDRGIAERDLQLVELEESFGWASWLQPAVPIPVCIRLHGPWFLNGPALGVARDEHFRKRVAREGRALERARAITAPSRDVLERTRDHYGLPMEQAEVIPNPAKPVPPARRWRLEECDPKQILFVGRFDRHKGGDLIIEAFGRVLESMPDVRLSFAGPNLGLVDDHGRRWDLEGFVDDRLPGARASGLVRLLGHQPPSVLEDLRRKALVTVVCSRYENFPYTAIEAMATGCPIVAAKVGGIPEIVRDGVDGLLHSVGDRDDLAAKIGALLADPARAAALGRHAAARCTQEFHPEVVANRMVDYYRRAIRRGRSC